MSRRRQLWADLAQGLPVAGYTGAVAPRYVPAGVQNYDYFTLTGTWSGTSDAGARGGYFVYLNPGTPAEVTFRCRGRSFGLWGFTDYSSKGPFELYVNGVLIPNTTLVGQNPNGSYYSWEYYTHPRQSKLTDFTVTLKFNSGPGIYDAYDGFRAIEWANPTLPAAQQD